ncbi:MAG: DUF2934 domain-containing protein [Proteobacteria bacterium]|jgi:hypothetical protein|nr:DUF2934 domain-containing protein [Pseudomonadota bacterium]
MTAKTRRTTETKPAKKPAAKKTEPAKASKPAKPAKAPEAPKPAKVPITQEMIAQRAYEIWLAAGRPHGQDHEIWMRAEAELRADSGARR